MGEGRIRAIHLRVVSRIRRRRERPSVSNFWRRDSTGTSCERRTCSGTAGPVPLRSCRPAQISAVSPAWIRRCSASCSSRWNRSLLPLSPRGGSRSAIRASSSLSTGLRVASTLRALGRTRSGHPVALHLQGTSATSTTSRDACASSRVGTARLEAARIAAATRRLETPRGLGEPRFLRRCAAQLTKL